MQEKCPEWLYKSLTFKKYNLCSYGYALKNKWDQFLIMQPTEEQMKEPMRYISDFPSCLHGIERNPEVITSFPYCLRDDMKTQAITIYTKDHPEILVTDEEITKLEGELKAKGIPMMD